MVAHLGSVGYYFWPFAGAGGNRLKMGVVVCAYNPTSGRIIGTNRWEGGEFKVRLDYNSRLLFQTKPETNTQNQSSFLLPGLGL